MKAAIGFLCHNEFQVMFDSPSSVPSIITNLKDELKMQPVMLINTLLSFMQYMEWTKIGIITELEHSIFFNTAEAIAKAIKENSNFTLSKMVQLPSNACKINHNMTSTHPL